jgi:hypothetical protein
LVTDDRTLRLLALACALPEEDVVPGALAPELAVDPGELWPDDGTDDGVVTPAEEGVFTPGVETLGVVT